MKRGGRLSPTSKVRLADLGRRAGVRETVFARDGGCVLRSFGGCFGGLTFHHLCKASQGGEYTEANGATLCVFHNDAVEDHPIIAAQLGLVVSGHRKVRGCA